MRTLTSLRLTWAMVAWRAWTLDEERQPAPHAAIGQVGQHEADDGHHEHDRVVRSRRDFSEQGRANDLEEIEQDVVVDDECTILGNRAIVPEDRGDDPIAAEEQQDDSRNREQARPL